MALRIMWSFLHGRGWGQYIDGCCEQRGDGQEVDKGFHSLPRLHVHLSGGRLVIVRPWIVVQKLKPTYRYMHIVDGASLFVLIRVTQFKFQSQSPKS